MKKNRLEINRQKSLLFNQQDQSKIQEYTKYSTFQIWLMDHISSPGTSNQIDFAHFLERGDSADLQSPGSVNVGGLARGRDFSGGRQQHSRPSMGSKAAQSTAAASALNPRASQGNQQVKSLQGSAAGHRAAPSGGMGSKQNNQKTSLPTSQIKISSKILIADGSVHQAIPEQNQSTTKSHLLQQQQQIQKYERSKGQLGHRGDEHAWIKSASQSPENPLRSQAQRQQRASNKKIGGGPKANNLNASSNITAEHHQSQHQAQVGSATGKMHQEYSAGAPYYGGPPSTGHSGAGVLLSATSKTHGAGASTGAANSALGESVASAGALSGHGVSGSQAQNHGAGHQYRNSKNRKLYTSIGAYNQSSQNQPQKMAAHGVPGSGSAIVQVPLINFTSSSSHQRNIVISQQHSVTSNTQSGPQPQNHPLNQNKAGGLKQDHKGKGLPASKERGARTHAAEPGFAMDYARTNSKNGKKLGNSSVLVVQPRDLHTAQYIASNNWIGSESAQGAKERGSRLQQDHQLGGGQLTYARAPGYQSMIDNNDASNVSMNIHDVSALSCPSQPLNFAQRQSAAAQTTAGTYMSNNLNQSVVIERIGGASNNSKKGKKTATSKNHGQQEAGWHGGPGGGRATGGGVLPSNFTKIGNFVGSSNDQLEGSLYEATGTTSGAAATKNAGKKVTSKMIPAGGHSKAAQHQHFQQNQIHFMNNFSVDESVTSGSGLPGHGDGLNQNLMAMQLNGNTGNPSSSNAHALAQQPKQRPHSSFKAQTQKQINTYKHQLIHLGGAAGGAGNATGTGAGGSANARGQLLLIGAKGVVGIGGGSSGSKMAGGVANMGGKTVGSRKNKHLTHQVNLGKNKYGPGGNTQQLNSMSVYQNDLVAEPNSRESRRMGRGSSGVGAPGAAGIELGNIAKEHREMRTSSATAGNTNTEFKLLSMTGLSGQDGAGPNGLLNFSNHNQHYMLGGGASATHAMSGASGLSGLSGGAVSAHTAGGGFGGKTGTGSLMFNLTAGSQANQKQPGKSNKISKRHLATNGGVNFNFQGGNILSSTAMSLNSKQQEQVAALMTKNNEKMQSNKFDKIDSMRSGEGGRDGGRGAKPSKATPLGSHQANQAMSGAGGYGLSMFPANKYDQQLQQQAASKAPKGPSNAGAPSSNNDGQSTHNQTQKAHQQSMQRFLQQQMTHYNTGSQSSSKNAKKANGLKSGSKQSNAAGAFHYQQLLQGHQGQGQIQGGQGQGQGQGAAAGYGDIVYTNKHNSQKSTKKPTQQSNLLASDRLRDVQQRGDAKDGARKGGTQITIGAGGKRAVLNSSQIQVSTQGQRHQAQSLSRSRGAPHANKQHQVSAVSATAMARMAPGGGASSVMGAAHGKRGGIQALSSISGAHGGLGPMGQLGAISGTPGIQGNSKIALIQGSASNQRNFNSNVQNTNHSSHTNQLARQDTYNSSSRRNKRGGAGTMSSGGGVVDLAPGAGSGYANRINVKQGTGTSTGHGLGSAGEEAGDLGALVFDAQSSLVQISQGQKNQQKSFDTSQMHYQIQIAEQALKEMRMSLNKQRAGGGSALDPSSHLPNQSQQQQARPKSQNDAQNYVLTTQEMATSVEAMSHGSKTMDTGPEVLSGQSRAMAVARDGRERDRASARGQMLAQERRNLDDNMSEDQKDELRGENHAGIHGDRQYPDQAQDVNSTFVEQRESIMNTEPSQAVDREQFLEIISCAFDKIIAPLHPRIGDSLNQIRSMYDHYIEQVEAAHQQELQQSAIQIQDLQACATELEVVNQQLEMQLGQNRQSSDQKSIQLNDFVAQNEDLLSQLKKHVKDNKKLKLHQAELQDKCGRQAAQINHLQSSIGQHGGPQHEASQNGMDPVTVSKKVIAQMKQSDIGAKGSDLHPATGQDPNQIVKDLDLLEKLRRAERNERTREEEPDEMVFCDKDDPLGLDGPILIGQRNRSGTGRRHFDQNHVRITNGEIVEQHSGQDDAHHQQQPERSRRRRMDGGGLDDLSDDLSSIPSYDMGSGGRSRPGMIGDGEHSAENMGPLDGAMDGMMIFDGRDDIDMKDLDIDEHEKFNGRVDHSGRLGEELDDGHARDQQSYFGSQTDQSSATIDSDMMRALQHAIAQNGGEPPDGLELMTQNISAASPEGQEAGMLMFPKSSNRPCAQDKSPIKVPALDFQALQDQMESEMLPQEADGEQQFGVDQLDEATQADVEPPPSDQMPFNPTKQNNILGKQKIPGLALGGLGHAGQPDQDASKGPVPPGVGFALDLSQLKNPKGQDDEAHQAPTKIQDFQDEFLEKVHEFSESWRQLLRKEKRF